MVKNNLDTAEEELSPGDEVAQRISNWFTYNLLETATQQGVLEGQDDKRSFGFEKEFIVVDQDWKSISRKGYKAVMDSVQNLDYVEQNDEGKPIVDFEELNAELETSNEQYDGFDPLVEWDMGSEEGEVASEPLPNPVDGAKQADILSRVVAEGVERSDADELEGARVLDLGMVPGATDIEAEGEPYDPRESDEFTMEDLFRFSVPGDRYTLHGYVMSSEAEAMMDMKPALEILGSASSQATLFPQTDHAFRNISSERVEAFLDSVEDPKSIDKIPEDLQEAADEIVGGYNGGRELLGLNEMGIFLTPPFQNSLWLEYGEELEDGEVVENGEVELAKHAKRNDLWDGLKHGKLESRRWLTLPEFQNIESVRDMVEVYTTAFTPEFGPEIDFNGREVPTAYSFDQEDRMSLKEMYDAGEANLMLITAEGEDPVPVTKSLDDLPADEVDMFQDNMDAIHPFFRMRPNGLWEGRPLANNPGESTEYAQETGPKAMDAMLLYSGFMVNAREVQEMFKDIGITEIPHESDDYVELANEENDVPYGVQRFFEFGELGVEKEKYGVMSIIEGVDTHSFDYVLPDNIHNLEDSLTVGELLKGTEEFEGVYDIVSRGIAEYAGDEFASEWRKRVEGYNSSTAQDIYDSWQDIRGEGGSLEDVFGKFEVEPLNTQ